MLYAVRHGETDCNARNEILGRRDEPLNGRGREQAAAAGRALADIPLDVIYTSPLGRTRETAEIIRSFQTVPCPVISTPCLIEQDFGIYEGRDRGDPDYQRDKRRFFRRFQDGESFLDLAARVYPFLADLRTSRTPEENILLVTHGGICRIITSFFFPMENEEFVTFRQENGAVSSFPLF